MLPKFAKLGSNVYPALTKILQQTIAAANIGSAKASIRRTVVPKLIIDSSGVMKPIIHGAVMYIRIPIADILTITMRTLILANLLAIAGRFAPML